MNVKYISIKREYIPLLLMLYPDYEFTESESVNSKFIMVRDVSDPATKNRMDYRYNDCIIISNKLFDELWDEDVLKQKVVEFARVRFKSRKRVVNTIANEGTALVDELKEFVFLQKSDSDSDNSEVLTLFELYGSAQFSVAYMKVLQTNPFPKVRAALITFLQKVIVGEASLFYRKKNMVLGGKIKNNFIKAYSSYRERNDDGYGLSFLKFLNDLIV